MIWWDVHGITVIILSKFIFDFNSSLIWHSVGITYMHMLQMVIIDKSYKRIGNICLMLFDQKFRVYIYIYLYIYF